MMHNKLILIQRLGIFCRQQQQKLLNMGYEGRVNNQ